MSYCLEEVFEMACQIERNGAVFYRRAAEAAGKGKMHDLFAELADWEVRHEQTFRELLAAIPEEQRTAYYDPQGEAASYLDMVVQGAVFDLTSDEPDLPETPGDLLRAAVAREKDSVIYYLGLKEVTPHGRDRVDHIIAEEMRHVRILTRLANEQPA